MAVESDRIRSWERFGALFCGGASRRMGRDKARLPWRGRPLLAHGIEVLEAAGAEVFLATGCEARYTEFNLPCALDRAPDLGPLGGLQAALAYAERMSLRCDDALLCVLACDMPHASALVFDALVEALGAADACLLKTPGGREPLFAVYRLGVLPAVGSALEQGLRKMDSFHAAIEIAYVESEALPPVAYASNWNTPEDIREGETS